MVKLSPIRMKKSSKNPEEIKTRKSSKLDHYKYNMFYVVANLGWLM